MSEIVGHSQAKSSTAAPDFRIRRYLKLTAAEKEEYSRELQTLSISEQEAIMEIETSWMKEGRQLGRQEGRELGRQEGLKEGRMEGMQEGRMEGMQEGRRGGMLTLVSRLLSRRLGPISESTLTLMQHLKPEQLEQLSDALLDFASPADLELWLRGQGLAN